MATNYSINFTDPLTSRDFQVVPYTTDGIIFPTVLQLDSSATQANTSFVIYGKGAPNYGERIQENILHLLENFSGATEPKKPLVGQLWFRHITFWRDTVTPQFYKWNNSSFAWETISIASTGAAPLTSTGYRFNSSVLYFYDDRIGKEIIRQYESHGVPDNNPISANATPNIQLVVYNGAGWVKTNSVFTSTVEPVNPNIGDLWYDSTGSPSQLNIWDGSAWVSPATGDFLPLSGGTLTGALIIKDDLIIQNGGDVTLQAGSDLNVTDNVTIGGTLNVTGGTTLGSPLIVNGATTINDSLNVTGATTLSSTLDVTGVGTFLSSVFLTVSGAPAGNEAVDKDYVDAAVLSGTGSPSLNSLIDVTITSPIDNNFLAYDSGTGQWINQTANQVGVLALTGGFLTGPLFLTLGSPVGATEAVDRAYVDSHSSINTFIDLGTFTGPGTGVIDLFLNDDHAIPIVTLTGFVLDASELPFAPSGDLISTDVQSAITELDTEKAPINNPTFTGIVTLGTGAILILDNVTPSSSSEAASKSYVDASVSAIGVIIDRDLHVVAGSPPDGVGPYTTPEYDVGTNKLWVHVSGIKAYSSIYGYTDVLFTPAKASFDTTGFSAYTVDSIDTSNDIISLTGNVVSDFTAGDQIKLYDNTGDPTPALYTIATVSAGGSPVGTVTDLSVVEDIPITTTNDGNVWIQYEFSINIDGGGFSTELADAHESTTFGVLAAHLDLTLTGASVGLVSGNLRFRSDTVPSLGISSIDLADGVVGTSALFTNLPDWFGDIASPPALGFNQVDSFIGDYFETGNPGDPSTQITFVTGNEPVAGEIMEFMVFN